MLEFTKRNQSTIRSNFGSKSGINTSSRAASTNMNKFASISSHNSLIKEIRIYKEMRRANKANIAKRGSIDMDDSENKENGLVIDLSQNRFQSVPCFN